MRTLKTKLHYKIFVMYNIHDVAKRKISGDRKKLNSIS